MEDSDEVLTPREVAAILKVSVRTLESWRSQGRGPRWVKVEGLIRYPGRYLQSYVNGWRAVDRLIDESGWDPDFQG